MSLPGKVTVMPHQAQILALLIVFGITLGGCSAHFNHQALDGKTDSRFAIERVIEDIVYTEPGWPESLRGDLYLPERRGPLAVVLTIHGGGWANRSREDMSDISRELAHHGYAVFNISYRFAPRYTHPAQLQDVQQALRWLATNARRYRLDAARINTWGYSSGAHLAALAASVDDSGAGLPRVNAVVAGGIPSDLRKYSGSPIVMRFVGGDRDEMPARYAEASPAYHVSPDDPPVFLYHGKLDLLEKVDSEVTGPYSSLDEQNVSAVRSAPIVGNRRIDLRSREWIESRKDKRWMGYNEVCAYVHTNIDVQTEDVLTMLLDYDSHYCRYFSNHESTWTLELDDRSRNKLAKNPSIIVDGKSSEIRLKRSQTITIPAGVGAHKVEIRTGR